MTNDDTQTASEALAEKDPDGGCKGMMWTAFREAWFKQCSSPISKERPEFEEGVARRVFEQWYSNNYE